MPALVHFVLHSSPALSAQSAPLIIRANRGEMCNNGSSSESSGLSSIVPRFSGPHQPPQGSWPNVCRIALRALCSADAIEARYWTGARAGACEWPASYSYLRSAGTRQMRTKKLWDVVRSTCPRTSRSFLLSDRFQGIAHRTLLVVRRVIEQAKSAPDNAVDVHTHTASKLPANLHASQPIAHACSYNHPCPISLRVDDAIFKRDR